MAWSVETRRGMVAAMVRAGMPVEDALDVVADPQNLDGYAIASAMDAGFSRFQALLMATSGVVIDDAVSLVRVHGLDHSEVMAACVYERVPACEVMAERRRAAAGPVEVFDDGPVVADRADAALVPVEVLALAKSTPSRQARVVRGRASSGVRSR